MIKWLKRRLLEKQYRKTLKEARDFQRRGDLREYAKKIEQAALLSGKLYELQTLTK